MEALDVGTIVRRAADRFADRRALEDHERTVTFAQLGDRVARIAGGLLGLGLRPGDAVLDLQTNSATYVETDLGIASAGLVRVALNHRLLPADWARIAEDAGARAIIYDAAFADAASDLIEGLPRAVAIRGDAPGTPFERLIADATQYLPDRGSDPDALVSLNYSSGTTGAPKGARRTHRNRVASMRNIVSDILLGPPLDDDAWLHAGPITHASGLFVLTHVAHGARQVILPRYDPELVVEAVADRGVTGTVLVPTMVARALALGERARMPGLRRLAYAGAPTPPEQIRRSADLLTPNLVQFYGLVEAIPPVTVLSVADHARGFGDRPDLLTSAGRACAAVELAVIGTDGGPVGPGEVGEVVTRGDHVMQGYFGEAGRSGDAAKTVVDGWLRTGDLGRIDDEGYLFLVDRRGDMIITGGYNVYPREVEDVLADAPGVAEVAVVGVADPEWGQRIVAVWAASSEVGVAVPDDAALAAFCRDRLASYKKPKRFVRVEEFPLSSTGKIAKNVLRQRLESGQQVGGAA